MEINGVRFIHFLLLLLFTAAAAFTLRAASGRRAQGSNLAKAEPVLALSTNPAENPTEPPRRPKSDQDNRRITAGTVQRDITYCTVEGVELKLDLYYPLQPGDKVPVILYLHGGGWTSGDKREAERVWEGLKHAPGGYVLAAANYRLAPAYRFPAQIQDAKCAVRFLRANVDRFGIDPDRIGVLGVSAGGHLAALLGLADGYARWDTGQFLEQSSRVKAVAVVAAPSDFSRDFPAGSLAMARAVFGAEGRDDPKLKQASPVSYEAAGAPPFLILQGEKDGLVPPEQAETLYEHLKEAGVEAELVMIRNGGHALQPVGGEMEPGPFEVALKMISFFGRHLG